MSSTLWLLCAGESLRDKPKHRLHHALRNARVQLDLLVHDPRLASLELADALAGLADATRVEPLFATGDLTGTLQALPESGSTLAIVAEEAQLTRLAALLVCGSTNTATDDFELEPGCALRLRGDFRPGGMRVSPPPPPDGRGAAR